MKDQYVADDNDYRKYGLLREITGHGALRSGVCWMLTPDDGRADGGFVRYLDQPGPFDPPLFDALAPCVSSGRRTVRVIEASGILPGARFHSDLLSDDAGERARYFARRPRRHLRGWGAWTWGRRSWSGPLGEGTL